MITILIPSTKEEAHLRRTLWSIATRRPNHEFQVVVVTDRPSDRDVIRLFSSMFKWKLVILGGESGEKCPLQYCSGTIIEQDGRCIAWEPDYDDIGHPGQVFEIPDLIIKHLDSFGSNLTPAMVEECKKNPVFTSLFKRGKPMVFGDIKTDEPGESVFMYQGGELFNDNWKLRTDISEVIYS